MTVIIIFMTIQTAPRWRLRILAIAVVALGTLASVFVTVTPAHAAHTACGSVHICVWTNGTFLNNPAYYWTAPTYNTCIPLGGSLNDNVRSIKQTAGFFVTIYEHAGCSGQIITTVANGIGEQLRSCNNLYGPWATPCWSPKTSSMWYVA